MKRPELSLETQQRARKRFPGMTQLLSKRPDMFSLGVWPGYYSRAKGTDVWDLDGNRYTDMSISGIGANVLGYADPDVDEGVVRAVRDGSSCSLNCPEEVDLADLLCELHPWADMVRLTRSGGEAMAVAVRIARAATGRDVVAFCGYHGWQDWYLAANLAQEQALDGHLIPGLAPAGVPRGLAGTALPFRYNRLDELEAIVEAHGPRLAAIVMEPIRSAPPQPGFLEGVKALAAKCGAVWVIDEISAGFRLLSAGAHMTLSPERPDMAVFSKALGNGYAISAVIGRREVMEAAQRTFISSTNWTERIGPAAALACLKKHRERDAGPHLVALGQKMQHGWSELGRAHGVALSVGGIPPLSHFSFEGELGQSLKALFVQGMLERGFLASTQFYPMLAHTMEQVDAYLQAAGECFAILAKSLREGGPDELLRGAPSATGFARLA